MASNHVPNDQVPMQGPNIYTDASYQNLFSSVDRYGPPSWETQLAQQSGLAPGASPHPWHHGTFTQQPFNGLSQPYANQTHGLRTASPYQYGQFSQQGAMGAYGQATNVDPSLGLDPNAIRQQQQSPYPMPMRNLTPQGHSGTVTPQALQQTITSIQNPHPTTSPFQIPKSTAELFSQQRNISTPLVQLVRVPEYEIPKGRKSGGLYVLDQAALAKATKSNALNKFVTLGSEPFHLSTNRTALPLYTTRLSLKDAKKAGANDKKLRAKLSSSRTSISKAPKSERKPAGSLLGLKREVSESESSSESSDDDSEYTDDEEDEVSPLPALRPEDPHAAVRYDIIKATWYPRTSSPTSDKIKITMRDFWEVLNTIQKRWRTDSKAVTEAEEQKKIGELPVLKSRVTSQRDLLHSALKAALENAHPDVLYHLGQIKPFLYLCYQFLANRFHSKDYDGTLSAVIFETLSRCGTLTTDLLEETKVIKALTSMKKHANEKHKAFIQLIIEQAASNSKKTKAAPSAAVSSDTKTAKRPVVEAAGRSTSDTSVTKRAKPTDPLVSTAKKEPATTAGSRTITTSLAIPSQKRPGERAALVVAPVKSRVSQVSNKPSSLFASLNAASKKPTPSAVATLGSKASPAPKGAATTAKEKKVMTAASSKSSFSFAQTMASLLKPKEQEVAPVKAEKQSPTETAEEMAKRLRKESRRHLRVTFRPEASLVAVRYFDHVPEEDMGHEENLVRDAGDIGGEGRMFKQHKELDIDEDDDDVEIASKPWIESSQVDFCIVKAEDRERNYMPFGGGQKTPICPEKEANVQRENGTLMVFYLNSSDIPSSPREPLDQMQETESTAPVLNFGAPGAEVQVRLPKSTIPVPAPDLSNLENIFKQFSASSTQPPVIPQLAPVQQVYAPPAPSVDPTVDLASILSTLQSQQQQAPAPIPVQAPIQPPAPPAFDMAAFMSLIQAQSAGGANLPPMPPMPPMPPGFPLGFNMPFPQPIPQPDYAGYQSQTQAQYDQQGNSGTKRPRDDNNSYNADRGQGKRPKNRDNRPHKVLACKFFQKGTCTKGDNCTYIHDLNL